MKSRSITLVAALVAAAALSATPLLAEARPGGGGGGGGGSPGYQHGGGGGGGYNGGYHGGYHGGYGYRGWYGGWGGWYGGYRGYWPGYYWGWGAVAYAPYYGYYGGYYGYPAYGAPVTEYVVAEPPPGDRVVRSGQPVPGSSPPDPIFYPRNGQTTAQTEADRQDCNRWATTQPRAMNDASIFQRATYACMEGRGYTVR
ncbi:MAG: hypothetical protein K8R60_00635 [Burkholderiales bacterium]|nr:hypothetical protein [Burkholderiales bacterium]